MILIPLIKKITELFIMMLFGVISIKAGWLKVSDSKAFSAFSVYVLCPCTILSSFQVSIGPSVLPGLAMSFAVCAVSMTMNIIVASVYKKIMHATPVERGSVIYSNGGNLILPIVTSLFGVEYTIYVSGFITVYNLFVWTHGVTLFSGDGGFRLDKIIKNPSFAAIGVGFIILLSGLQFPEPLANAISDMGFMIGGIGMFITGMIIGGIDIRSIFAKKRIWSVIFLRHILCPLLILFVIKVLRLESCLGKEGSTILLIAFLSLAAPSGAMMNQFAIMYNRDADYASAINVLSTLLCILTMPVMVWLFLTIHV